MKTKNSKDKEAKIKEIISKHLGISLTELTESADLREDLNAEDIEIADLIAKLEKEFAVALAPDEVSGIKTIGDITELFRQE